ncbi:P-loop containing nucleoside triphosphate hydrolase protein [Xylaria arbuscula]|nr:P-loop containing nucleoside triphosphate hydrolase protein [Xylaria arbuscula]
MERDEPPDEKFEFLLPATRKGVNMRRKKWYDLVPERVKEVSKAKDLIQALASTPGTDLIEGKGNGLILLLHGSPGTRKTLTAESVAEIAEKPLYRVTCADIGTKAEAAEKYLESMLHLGKLWRCVVLLDEAGVFLEQRSQEDLERNSLVSVFLRILEYYEGILILTTNRVGTFDEVFKSRIQLALHYPTLGPYQRLQVWQNFLERFEKQRDDTVETGDLCDHLDELCKEDTNGRKIRNALPTARQYAKWKGERLNYAKLKDVIEVAGWCDKYLVKLHKGLTQDQLAEDE